MNNKGFKERVCNVYKMIWLSSVPLKLFHRRILNTFYIQISILYYFSLVGLQRQQVHKADTLQLLLGDPEMFPGQRSYTISPASPGPSQGPLTSEMCLENFQTEALRKHPNQMANLALLTPFDAKKQQFSSELPQNNGAPHSVFKVEPIHLM